MSRFRRNDLYHPGSLDSRFRTKGTIMKKLLLVALCFCLLPTLVLAKAPVTHLGGDYQLQVPKDVIVLPAVPKVRLLPKPGIKPFKTDNFQTAQCQVPQGFWLETGLASERGKDILKYFATSPEVLDSMKLRFIAREVKNGYLKKLQADGPEGARGLKITDKYIQWYRKHMYMPIPLLIDVGFGSGPAMGPIPCGMKGEKQVGDLFKKVFGTNELFFNTIMLIEDIKDAFDVSAAIGNDTLDLVFCHENAHGIMFDMYGNFMDRVQKISNIGHDSAMISDRGLAYIEGWAEAFEALYGPTNPQLKLKPAEREKYRISEFLFGRQDPIRRQRYIWTDLKKKTGLLKTGNQILGTEGVIAGVFHDILTHGKLKDTFRKSVSVMYYYRPVDMADFLRGWVKLFPADQRILLRIFLENTNYATASNEARKLYHDYYQAKLLYVKKQLPKEKFFPLKKAWESHKETVFSEVMKDMRRLTANVGHDLWLEVGSGDYKGLRVDLNNATGGMLIHLLGLAEEDAVQLMQVRSAQGYLKGSDPIKALADTIGAAKAQAAVAKMNLTAVKMAPLDDNRQGWLRVVANVDENVLRRIGEGQSQKD